MWRLRYAVIVLLMVVRGAFAWDAQGHMMVAVIAYRELDGPTRSKVDAILRAHPAYAQLSEKIELTDPDRSMLIFARAATWPDLIRSGKDPMHGEDRPAWHSISLPVNQDGKQGPAPVTDWDGKSEPANIVQALAKADKDLMDHSTTAARKAVELCWLEHLVGDVHQPLDAAALFSKDFPKGDRGGNDFMVGVGGKSQNLHNFWDGMLGHSNAPWEARNKALELLVPQQYSRTMLAEKLAATGYLAWAQESAEVAQRVAYADVKPTPKAKGKGAAPDPVELPDDYKTAAGLAARERVVLAGYRLADRIKELVVG